MRQWKRGAALALCAALGLGLTGTARAEEPQLVLTMRIGSPTCVIGSEVTQVDPQSAAVSPIAESGRTLVPIRRILEAFGGTVEWVAQSGEIRCSLDGNTVELKLDSTDATVNGETVTLDVPARAKNNRTFVPVRFVSEELGLQVGYEPKNQIVVVADGDLPTGEGLSGLRQVTQLVSATTPREDHTAGSGSVTYAEKTVAGLKLKVITVDPKDPKVSIRANLSGGMLNQTSNFSGLAASGAKAVINANFFEAYQAVKDPIGHLMVNGQFVYASSGITSVGITDSGEVRWGRPSVFVRLKTVDEKAAQQWAAFEVNVLKQFANQSVLYTPVRGGSFPVTYPGVVLTVRNGKTFAYQNVNSGDSVAIPSDGYVLYSSREVTQTDYYRVPELGRQVALEPYLYKADPEGFTLDGVTTMISGAPRLVKDGAIDNSTDAGFTEARFTTASTARTAIGSTKDGKLLLVQTASATIPQLKQAMLALGCVDAVNLDGGASSGMYCNGSILANPGRGLVATLQVFVEP